MTDENGDIIIYQTDDGLTKIDVKVQNETVWLSQQQMAELFSTSRTNVIEHINNIYLEEELDKNSTCQNFRQVRKEGNRNVSREIPFYNLDMIISLGYRIKSKVATNFRKWATLNMEKSNIQKILNYYLEYEIYNIANSSQIKTDLKNCYILKGKIDSKEIIKELNKLKQNEIRSVTEKFIGKRIKDKEGIINEIIQELNNLNSEQSNQIQVVFRIESLLKEKIKNIDTKIIKNFANQICDIKGKNEFWMYSHNMSLINKNSRSSKKLPIFILKCEFENERIKVIDANVNSETINTILTILLEKEIADISIEYEEAILNYSKEIKSSIDSGEVEHIIDLFYNKLSEYIDSQLTRENIKRISQKNLLTKVNSFI